MVICEYGYGCQPLPLSIFKQGTGSTRHVEITYAYTSPSICAQCRLFSKLMATPPSYRRWRESPGTNGSETGDNGMGWFASGGLDRCVKVNNRAISVSFINSMQIWDLSVPHIPAKQTYTLHPRYPIRHVLWRPGYECEVAVISNPELAPPAAKTDVSKLATTPPFLSRSASSITLDTLSTVTDTDSLHPPVSPMENKGYASVPVVDDTIEIWDVRRAWVAKWSIRGSGAEGSLTGTHLPRPGFTRCDTRARRRLS